MAQVQNRAVIKRRTALSNLGGKVVTQGDHDTAELLKTAWQRAKTEDKDHLTHGFHAYPARMPWPLAHLLIERYSRAGDTVLDPFCGSGTSLIEAFALGRQAVGSDLSRFALELASLKLARTRTAFRKAFIGAAERSARRARAEGHWCSGEDAPDSAFDAHIGHELKALREAIQPNAPMIRQALLYVLSSILVKCSKQEAHTQQRQVQRRLGKGLPTQFFLRKAAELAERWQALEHATSPKAPPPLLACCDARTLSNALNMQATLIVTSPPYGGTYDYATHHTLSLRWLCLSARALNKHEIGSRRSAQNPNAAARWLRDLEKSLRNMSSCLRPTGHLALVLGDSQIRGELGNAQQHIKTMAKPLGLQWVASATLMQQARSNHPPRGEHLIVFRKYDT